MHKLLLLLVLWEFSPEGLAWGHSINLNSELAKSHLVFPALKHRVIKFCVEVNSPRFSSASISLQTEAALKLWLSAAKQDVKLTQVSCGGNDFNLKVLVGEEEDRSRLEFGSYQIPEGKSGHSYSLVKIDSKYVFRDEGKQYRYNDFSALALGNLQREKSLIDDISFRRPRTLDEIASQRGVDLIALSMSSYAILIHEIGHSFGLCDTAEESIDGCDPVHSSRVQPESVMRSALAFYPLPDDVQGIRKLFKRFHK